MTSVKKICTLCVLLSISHFCFAQIHSSQQLIPSEHWIYDALYMLNSESGRISLADNAPLPVSEIKMYMADIDYDALSDSGKKLYEKAQAFLKRDAFSLKYGDVAFGFNMIAKPSLMYKSTGDIDWTFATDYTGHAGPKPYGAASSFIGSDASDPFITVPLYLTFGNAFVIETDPCFAKSFWGMSNDGNFTNLPYDFNDFDFLWPRNAYGSAGAYFNKWGVNVNIAHEGMRIGKTQTGSIIYNSTFETDAYVQFNLYSPHIRYGMNVVEIARDKFLYTHRIEAAPFKWIRAGVIEGTLVSRPFEFRFLNPLMIMHSFGAWTEYISPEDDPYYGEAHVCAYMGIDFDIVPCKNVRIYGLYAQNEIQSAIELESETGKTFPDSFGVQLGVELTFPESGGGYWIATTEAVYTTPFCYVKQGAEWSLYRERFNMQDNCNIPICSWIGTPFGPDCIGAQARVGYVQPGKWSADFEYLFVAHGTNSFGLFGNEIDVGGGKKYYSYYPSVLYKIYKKKGGTQGLSASDAASLARTHRLTGIVQYTNCITLKGNYILNKHFQFGAQTSYSFVFNNKNVSGSFAHGIELSLSCTYTML